MTIGGLPANSKKAELKAKAERQQQQREGAEAIWALIAALGLTGEDLQEMFPPNDQPSVD